MISVIVPLFNKAPYIERTLDSVLRQTYDRFEVIVVDDASTDGGDELVEALQEKHACIRLIRRANGGQSAARNTGIEAARGELVAFLDADDQWEPGYLAALAGLKQRYPAAGVYATGYRVIYSASFAVDVTIPEHAIGQNQYLIDDYFRRAAGYSFIWISAVAIPTHIFKELGTFLEGEHIGGDTEMIGRVALRCPVAYDRRILAYYRADAQGRQNPRRDRGLQTPPFARTLAESVGSDVVTEATRADATEYLARLWLNYAGLALDLGDRRELRRVLDQELADNGTFRWKVRFLRFGSRYLPLSLLVYANRLINSRWALWMRKHQLETCAVQVRRYDAGNDQAIGVEG